MGKLDGKVAIITGAAGGMGRAQAALFVAEGATVLLADTDPAGSDVAAALGDRAEFHVHDVTDETSWARLVASAEQAHGSLDILVNTAGIVLQVGLLDTTTEDFERIFRVNSLGPFLGMRTAAPAMQRAGGGTIVNVASAAAMKVLPGAAAYANSKAGLRMLMQVAQVELAPLNIRVNGIFPGPIDTPMIRPDTKQLVDQVMASTPAARMGSPEEVAKATLFLASDDSSYVYGAELTVDGGYVL